MVVAERETRHSLLTGTDVLPAAVVAELKTIPQMRSTQTAGVPVWVVGSLELVAQGMVIQSVAQLVPTLLPSAGEPPVTLKDIAGVLAGKGGERDGVSTS